MSNYFITDHMVPDNLHEALNLISKDFSVPKVVTYLLQSLDSLSTNI